MLQRTPTLYSQNLPDICASVEKTYRNYIAKQTAKSGCNAYNIKQIALAGGVSANTGLRLGLQELCAKNDMGKLYTQNLNTVLIMRP
jgi:N6-L-threonylcarbamoyladenine synthase